MTDPLPRPTSTTDVFLAAVVERLDALLVALTPAPPAITPTPAPRRRPNKPAGEQP